MCDLPIAPSPTAGRPMPYRFAAASVGLLPPRARVARKSSARAVNQARWLRRRAFLRLSCGDLPVCARPLAVGWGVAGRTSVSMPGRRADGSGFGAVEFGGRGCAAPASCMRKRLRPGVPRLSIRSFGHGYAPGGFILWDGTVGLGRREPGCDVWWGFCVRLCAGDLAVTPGWGEVRRFDLVIGLAVLCRPGGDLLSRVLRRSTIGAEGFNGRVRNGIGFRPLARTTRPAEHSKVNTGFFRAEPRPGIGHGH